MCVVVGGKFRVGEKCQAYNDLPFWVLTQKIDSQNNEGCQISNDVRDGPIQYVVMERSAPKYMDTGWVRSNSMFTT